MSSVAEKILIPPGCIINKNVYIFLYCLVKNIILKGNQKEEVIQNLKKKNKNNQ